MADERFFLGGPLQGLLADIDDWCGTPPRPGPRHPHLADFLVGIAIAALANRITDARLQSQANELSQGLIQHAGPQVASNR